VPTKGQSPLHDSRKETKSGCVAQNRQEKSLVHCSHIEKAHARDARDHIYILQNPTSSQWEHNVAL
jgi:hypothetical protein